MHERADGETPLFADRSAGRGSAARAGKGGIPARRAGEHAIVIGSGIAGLFAARGLADRFDRVTILDRDELPGGPVGRRKTPQAPHSHLFGARGYALLCEMFPGIDDDLAAAGAPRFDYLRDHWIYAGAWAPRFTSQLEIRSSTRMLLEWRMRERLSMQQQNIEIRSGIRVEHLLWDQGRVRGVQCGGGEEMRADLVVDAAGLASRTPRWLVAAGYDAPREERVDMRGAVVSCVFRPPPGRATDWVMLTVKDTPTNPRSAAAMHIEGGLLRVSMLGWGGLRPPRDLAGFMDFARQMQHPGVYDAIKDAEPVSPVYFYGNSMSRWVCYHELRRFPDGLAVIGDAVFHGNPEHAQGMTFCARAVQVLTRSLDQVGRADRNGLGLRFQRRLGRLYGPYWTWNTGIELGVSDIVAEPPRKIARLLQGYYRQLRRRAFEDEELMLAMLRVHQADRHPSSLLHPSILWRLVRSLWRTAMAPAVLP
jgi:flavin-dependent dehydrogenase